MASWQALVAIEVLAAFILKADAGDRKRFVVPADEKLAAFLELQRAIHKFAVSLVA